MVMHHDKNDDRKKFVSNFVNTRLGCEILKKF
jgi:hypothetical protein